MADRYDLLTSRTDNNGKKHWQKVGVMFPGKNGDSFNIRLNALPLPDGNGEVSVAAFPPRDNSGGGKSGGGDDDIPW